jgi:uncharacterized membrane protein
LVVLEVVQVFVGGDRGFLELVVVLVLQVFGVVLGHLVKALVGVAQGYLAVDLGYVVLVAAQGYLVEEVVQEYLE